MQVNGSSREGVRRPTVTLVLQKLGQRGLLQGLHELGVMPLDRLQHFRERQRLGVQPAGDADELGRRPGAILAGNAL
mgnify:CR=1 FL=1